MDQLLDKDRNPEEITMVAIAAMASSIHPCLEFTWDAPCMSKTGMMPVLDTQIWIGFQNRTWDLPDCLIPDQVKLPTKHGKLKRIILYKFYRKEIANRTPFNARSAYPEKDRISTISQEYVRRFKNTSRELDRTHLETIIQEFSQDLMRGGFKRQFINTCLTAATKGYQKMLE